MTRRIATLLCTLMTIGPAASAIGAEPLELGTRDGAGAPHRMTMYLRLDNDSFMGSDRGYTSGVKFGFTSPTVASFDDPQLPARVRGLDRRLAWLQPRGFVENNVSLSVGQAMYTPEDWRREDPDPLDRPYAGVLAFGVTFNGRDSNSMRTTTLNVGMVGPSAGAEQTQNFVHGLLDVEEFRGWNHQLRDEPIARILHQRLRKWDLTRGARVTDAIVHYGGSVGNLATFANAGLELRFGRALPDNFGSAPALPVSEDTAPTRVPFRARQSLHGFVAFDVRYVLHDITLDGNTWRDSPSIERERLVADLGIGIALYWGTWKVTFARYFRSHEFASEATRTELGSITIRRNQG